MKDHGVIEAKEAPGYASLEIKRLQHNLPFPFSDSAPASEGTTLQAVFKAQLQSLCVLSMRSHDHKYSASP